ncbi:MAG: glycosyltransferase [Thermoleophilia bacterium]
MPAFNEAASIVASVDAMRLLEYSQYEIVVVDDGSSDATLDQLIAAYELVPTKAPLRVQITTQPVRAIYVSQRIPNRSRCGRSMSRSGFPTWLCSVKSMPARPMP